MFFDKCSSKKKGKGGDKTDKARRIAETMEKIEFKNYIDNLKNFNTADFVLLVVDARIPLSGHYAPYDGLLGDHLLIVINKIDLAPRESVISWFHFFNTITHTFAICAEKSIDPIIEYLENAKEKKSQLDIVITGINNVGKRTIQSKLKAAMNISPKITKPWDWVRPCSDLAAIGAIPVCAIADNRIAHARDFLSRCSIFSIMEVFGITFYSEPDVVLRIIDQKKTTAPYVLFGRLAEQKYLFYTASPSNVTEVKDISNSQKRSFYYSKTMDQHPSPFICLGSPTPATILPQLVPALEQMAAEKN
ncbi:hypothetical protein TVAG_494000 [Trichomonas vaginalis G3]|uniref:G domain-containing protein n=1 Tax=Trichomonas vaginalis (strain ATCC PRA-98 / G3) TaxID=412133 RepID=A2DQ31_TRIV3|nr:GTP-binding protein-related family [Trichomonas vaginalis G3]EAY17458.1 hypothetical protein TVAG_494000 [Trichomonas vaginalis G3]KAI5533564.1 GTP-binding protein-related family [Trichomonas vaginalis G3]|eukprot:XP_001329593.1 hypothetical protein [Trichomonas vaginalis G3]